MAVYPMKHRVDLKVILHVIDPWSRVDRNIPVGLWGKKFKQARKIGVPPP